MLQHTTCVRSSHWGHMLEGLLQFLRTKSRFHSITLTSTNSSSVFFLSLVLSFVITSINCVKLIDLRNEVFRNSHGHGVPKYSFKYRTAASGWGKLLTANSWEAARCYKVLALPFQTFPLNLQRSLLAPIGKHGAALLGLLLIQASQSHLLYKKLWNNGKMLLRQNKDLAGVTHLLLPSHPPAVHWFS